MIRSAAWLSALIALWPGASGGSSLNITAQLSPDTVSTEVFGSSSDIFLLDSNFVTYTDPYPQSGYNISVAAGLGYTRFSADMSTALFWESTLGAFSFATGWVEGFVTDQWTLTPNDALLVGTVATVFVNIQTSGDLSLGDVSGTPWVETVDRARAGWHVSVDSDLGFAMSCGGVVPGRLSGVIGGTLTRGDPEYSSSPDTVYVPAAACDALNPVPGDPVDGLHTLAFQLALGVPSNVYFAYHVELLGAHENPEGTEAGDRLVQALLGNTITWQGIASVRDAQGNPIEYTLSSASQVDYTQPHVVPLPMALYLFLSSLAAMVSAVRLRRNLLRRPAPP